MKSSEVTLKDVVLEDSFSCFTSNNYCIFSYIFQPFSIIIVIWKFILIVKIKILIEIKLRNYKQYYINNVWPRNNIATNFTMYIL